VWAHAAAGAKATTEIRNIAVKILFTIFFFLL